MKRRDFLAGMATVSVIGIVPALARGNFGSPDGGASSDLGAPGTQSYAYYEPLGETDPHDQSETDGTTYNMPCIEPADVSAAVDKTYHFWHGHDGTDHLFTVKAADFQALQMGQSVLLYTTMVEDHRHALLIQPGTACDSGDN
jgi:hypothetical protein